MEFNASQRTVDESANNTASSAPISNPVLVDCSVKASVGRPHGVDNTSGDGFLESVTTTWSVNTTMADRQPLPTALLRVTSVKTGACLLRTAASSTPRARALAVRAGLCPDRPDSALSNLSELDSGYDELRSFTVTPIIPPELVITGPQDDHRDVLPAEMTSSSVDNEEGEGERKHEDRNGFEESKSILEKSQPGQSEAFPEDRCNTSSIIDQEDLSVNTGTGNSSAVSISSLDAAQSCRLSANNSEYNEDRRTSTWPILCDQERASKETGSSLTVSILQAEGSLLTPVQLAEDERSVESERSSLSAVDDEATTSRLELFQISALNDSSYEADRTRNSSAEESAVIDIDIAASEAGGMVNAGRPDDVDDKSNVDKSEWGTSYDDDEDVDQELKFRCSSALGDWTPPLSNSVEISTCEPIQRRPPHGQMSTHGEIFDEPLTLSSEAVEDVAESHSDHETEKDIRAVCDEVISQSRLEDDETQSDAKTVGKDSPSSIDHVDTEVSCSTTQRRSEPEADSRSNVGKRVTSDRRSRRREKLYGGKRRRASPHPSSVYRLSLPDPPKRGLWQPWQDDPSSQATVEPPTSLQTALENLRCLSVLSNTSSQHGASVSAVATSATGNMTSFVNRITSPAQAMGGWSELSRCPATSGYFRLPQYRSVDVVMTPCRPQCRLANVQPPKFPKLPSSVTRSCPPLSQFCESPLPPYPLVHPMAGSVFDARAGRRWSIGRCHRALSPTVEELSPSSGPPTTTAPVFRRPAYGVDNYFHWDHENPRRSRVGDGHHQYSEEGQSTVESGSGRLNRFSASAGSWSTSAVYGDQPEGHRSGMTFQRNHLTTHWHLTGKHTRHDTF